MVRLPAFEMFIMKFVICRGDIAVEYVGELIDERTGKEREQQYAKDESKGCFMFFFKDNGNGYW